MILYNSICSNIPYIFIPIGKVLEDNYNHGLGGLIFISLSGNSGTGRGVYV